MQDSENAVRSPGLSSDPGAWTRRTLSELNAGLYEREDAVAMTLLTVMSGQSVFLYGPPGTAKSLIARRISCIFEDAVYFEYLMQRFSTPEEIFGPVSISELKNDRYTRITGGYLPEADVAFLDEIWKSSPAILNTLLTIINERRFKNGSDLVEVPLKAVIAASNEIPVPGSGLDALYDRFITRLRVDPVEDDSSFLAVVSDNSVSGTAGVSDKVSTGDWISFISRINGVPLSESAAEAVLGIRAGLRGLGRDDGSVPVYVSDRRWQKAVFLVKAAALLSGRQEVSPADALVLKNCLWSMPEDRRAVSDVVDSVLLSYYDGLSPSRHDIEDRLARLDKEVKSLFRNSKRSAAPPTVINDVACYELEAAIGPNAMAVKVYVPFGPKTVGGIYNAYSANGSTSDSFGANYMFQVTETDGETATIKFTQYSNQTYRVPLRFGGTGPVSSSAYETYVRAVGNLLSDAESASVILSDAVSAMVQEASGPFVSKSDRAAIRKAAEGMQADFGRTLESVRELSEYIEKHDS